MKTLTRSDREFPCCRRLAKFGSVTENTTAPRRCPVCRVKYEVSFVPATDHAHEMTGRAMWRTVWRVA